MKRSRFLLAALVLLLGGVEKIEAQIFSVTITADENGNGTLTNTSGFSGALPFTVGQDPGPGGLANALIYGLFNPSGLTAGDVVVNEPGGGMGDLIRFNPNQNNGSMVFYSALGGGALADVGFPTSNYANMLTVAEGTNGVINYTPTSGQPGFVAGAAGPVTYILTSGASAVPEPASFALFGMTALAAAGYCRWRRRRQMGSA